jgi:hypothetical protein
MRSIIGPAGLASAVVIVIAGCAGSGGGGVVDTRQFPSAAEVDAIAARPAPPLQQSGASAVSAWTFKGPFPETFADVPLADVDAVSGLIAPVAGRRLTEAGRCVARELAHFLLAEEAFPDERLKSHLAGRCGSMGRFAGGATLHLTQLAAADDDATVLGRVKEQIAAQAASLPERHDLGLAFARSADGTSGFAVTVALVVDARLKPTSRRARDGAVILEGEVVDGAAVEVAWASANRGATGISTCEQTGGTLPSFVFRCPVDSADVLAAVGVSVRDRGRFLGRGVGDVLVLPSTTDPPLAWAAPVWGEPAPLGDDDAALGAAIVARVNAVRQGAGLVPLTTESLQTQTVTRLAPHYFGHRDDSGLLDRIALGALAGWQVKTPVRNGDFSSVLVPGQSLDELVGAALESPSTRGTLLDPRWSLVALGAMRSEHGTGLMMTTWERYDTRNDAALAKRLFNELKAERMRRRFTNGLGEIGMEDAVAKASARLSAGEDPTPVLRTLLHQTSEQMQNEFTGWSIVTNDPEHIAWPPELLTANMTYVAIAAGSSVEPGSPWASTAVLIVGHVAAGTVADLDDDLDDDAAILPAR